MQLKLQLKLQLPFPVLTCVFYIGAPMYSWCGRCYISACVVQPRLRRAVPSSARRPLGASGFSAEERKLILQLLELLRSGALTSLTPTVPEVSADITAPPNVKQPKTGPTGKAPVAPTSPVSGWKLVKSTKLQGAEVKEKLLPNGWSVPIKIFIAGMNSSSPGICMVSTSQARKVVMQ